MVFTGPDKALLDRTARNLAAQAVALKWESELAPKARKTAKLNFDRLMRDARDLRALAKRLYVKPAAPVPELVKYADGGKNATPLILTEAVANG